jgi:hypothetical protein
MGALLDMGPERDLGVCNRRRLPYIYTCAPAEISSEIHLMGIACRFYIVDDNMGRNQLLAFGATQYSYVLHALKMNLPLPSRYFTDYQMSVNT